MGTRWEKLPNAGGYRLKRLESSVLELLKAKDDVSGGSGSISHLSLASEVTAELDNLNVGHPDLHLTHRSGDPVDVEYVKFMETQLFLVRLRDYCLASDLKSARALWQRMTSNG